MAAVDPELMARWTKAGPADLELVNWARRCPEERIEALVATANAMNDAPTDDLDMADTIVDAAMVRAEIEARAAHGLEFHGVLAVTADGDAAGSTEVFRQPAPARGRRGSGTRSCCPPTAAGASGAG